MVDLLLFFRYFRTDSMACTFHKKVDGCHLRYCLKALRDQYFIKFAFQYEPRLVSFRYCEISGPNLNCGIRMELKAHLNLIPLSTATWTAILFLFYHTLYSVVILAYLGLLAYCSISLNDGRTVLASVIA